MKIFIDSADPKDIREAWDTGMIDGVTTNPTLATKAGIPFKDAVREIFEITDGPVSLEVLGTSYDEMIREAEELAKIDEHVVVKLPMMVEGIKACKTLTEKGVKTNMTLVFSSGQALLAAKAGATYVSPFIGRLMDISNVGLDIIAEIRDIYDNYGFATQILVASERVSRNAVDAALLGADVMTMTYKSFNNLFKHPLTDVGLKRFLKDWKESEQETLV